jgi:hypothetical protein
MKHILLAGLFSLGLLSNAQAASIRYTFDAAYDDGAVATGFFDWDTDLPDIASPHDGASNNYEISFSGGAFSDLTYTDEVDGFMSTAGSLVGVGSIMEVGDLFSGVNSRNFTFIVDTNLFFLGTDLYIPLTISPGNTYEADFSSGVNFRNMISGSLTGTLVAVPEPSTALLLGIGLTGLAGKGRRRNRS